MEVLHFSVNRSQKAAVLLSFCLVHLAVFIFTKIIRTHVLLIKYLMVYGSFHELSKMFLVNSIGV